MLSTIQSLSTRIAVDTRTKAVGELFSAVANGRIQDIKTNKAPSHELVGIYQKVRDEFIALCGDHRVGEYRRKDLQHYVDEFRRGVWTSIGAGVTVVTPIKSGP